MIQLESRLNIADNTGVKEIGCIKIPGYSRKKYATIGDVIIASVKSTVPNANIKKGTIVKAVIVRVKQNFRRKDGTYIKFGKNSAVIINEDGTPTGTRIFGPVARELREKKYMKIVSLAPEVL